MNERTVTTPADLAGAPRHELLDALDRHEHALVLARHGIGEPVPAAQLAGHALDALVTARALAESAQRWSWVAQCEALTYGAALVDVAAACGLDVDELLAGLRARIDAQVRHAVMTRAEADELLALLARAEQDGGR